LSRVIISIDPKQRSRLYWFLRRGLGKTTGEKIGLGQSEVWAVPTEQLTRLRFWLRVFGSRLTQIPADFNQLFKWVVDPLPQAHDDMFKNARAAHGVTGIGMMRAQQVTLTEYALFLGADTPATPRDAPPDNIAPPSSFPSAQHAKSRSSACMSSVRIKVRLGVATLPKAAKVPSSCGGRIATSPACLRTRATSTPS
jgi:hypothetical protein